MITTKQAHKIITDFQSKRRRAITKVDEYPQYLLAKKLLLITLQSIILAFPWFDS